MLKNRLLDNDPLVTASNARQQLGNVSATTLWRWEKQGLICFTHIAGRKYIRQSLLDQIKDGGAGR